MDSLVGPRHVLVCVKYRRRKEWSTAGVSVWINKLRIGYKDHSMGRSTLWLSIISQQTHTHPSSEGPKEQIPNPPTYPIDKLLSHSGKPFSHPTTAQQPTQPPQASVQKTACSSTPSVPDSNRPGASLENCDSGWTPLRWELTWGRTTSVRMKQRAFGEKRRKSNTNTTPWDKWVRKRNEGHALRKRGKESDGVDEGMNG